MEQFADVTRRRIEVDDAQKPLLTELNAVKQQINEFNQKRTEVVVSAITCGFLRITLTYHSEQSRGGCYGKGNCSKQFRLL
jgi:hypothetical protein